MAPRPGVREDNLVIFIKNLLRQKYNWSNTLSVNSDSNPGSFYLNIIHMIPEQYINVFLNLLNEDNLLRTLVPNVQRRSRSHLDYIQSIHPERIRKGEQVIIQNICKLYKSIERYRKYLSKNNKHVHEYNIHGVITYGLDETSAEIKLKVCLKNVI